MSSALKAKTSPFVVVPSPAPDAIPDASRQENSALAVCSRCYGTSMEVVTGRGARRCECRKQEDQAELLQQARIPRRYEGCSLSNYRPAPNNGSQLQAFDYAFKLIDDYPAIDRGLLFMGTVGVGKTHLATAILRGLVERGVSCLFYEFGSLLKEIQNSFNPVAYYGEDEQ